MQLIQWNWPDKYGEDVFCYYSWWIAYIEITGLKVIGDWLEDSGWVEVLVQAKVASAGIADSFVKVSRATRTRHAHQITSSSLYILLKKSLQIISCITGTNVDKQSPQFQFWYTALHLELLILIYVKSLHTADFLLLYIESNPKQPSCKKTVWPPKMLLWKKTWNPKWQPRCGKQKFYPWTRFC